MNEAAQFPPSPALPSPAPAAQEPDEETTEKLSLLPKMQGLKFPVAKPVQAPPS